MKSWTSIPLLVLLGISATFGEIGQGAKVELKRSPIGSGTSVGGIGSEAAPNSKGTGSGIGEGVNVEEGIGHGARVSRQIGSDKRLKRNSLTYPHFFPECTTFYDRNVCYTIYNTPDCEISHDLTCWSISGGRWNCTTTADLDYLNIHRTACSQRLGNQHVYDHSERKWDCSRKHDGSHQCRYTLPSSPYEEWRAKEQEYAQRVQESSRGYRVNYGQVAFGYGCEQSQQPERPGDGHMVPEQPPRETHVDREEEHRRALEEHRRREHEHRRTQELINDCTPSQECNMFFDRMLCYEIYRNLDCNTPNDKTCWRTQRNEWNCTTSDHINYYYKHLTGCSQRNRQPEVHPPAITSSCQIRHSQRICHQLVDQDPFKDWPNKQREYSNGHHTITYGCRQHQTERPGDGSMLPDRPDPRAQNSGRGRGYATNYVQTETRTSEFTTECNDFHGRHVCFQVYQNGDCTLPNDMTCWSIGSGRINCTLTDNVVYLHTRSRRSYRTNYNHGSSGFNTGRNNGGQTLCRNVNGGELCENVENYDSQCRDRANGGRLCNTAPIVYDNSRTTSGWQGNHGSRTSSTHVVVTSNTQVSSYGGSRDGSHSTYSNGRVTDNGWNSRAGDGDMREHRFSSSGNNGYDSYRSSGHQMQQVNTNRGRGGYGTNYQRGQVSSCTYC